MKSKEKINLKLACTLISNLKAFGRSLNNYGHRPFVFLFLVLFTGCNCKNPTQVPINKTLIKGTVTDSLTGQPLQYTVVSAGNFTAVTDTLGRYRLTGMEGGTYTITYDRPDWHLNYAEATVAKDDSVVVNIKLYPCQWEIVPLNLPAPWSLVNAIREIYFINELEGWAVGFYHEWGWAAGYGVILHTTDGGYNWEMQYGCPNINETYYDIDFIDNQTGWAGPGKGLKHTTNGGLNWDTLATATLCFDFINANNGWYTDGYAIYRTTDGGQNWEGISPIASSSGTQYPLKMVARDMNEFWIREFTTLQVTRDGGQTWTMVFENLPNPSTGFYTLGGALDVLPPGHIWVEGKYSSDNGTSWVSQPYDTSWHYFSSSFCNPSYGWRSGANHALTEHGFYHTINSGKTWTKSSIPGVSYIHSSQFINKRRGWAAGWTSGSVNILIYK